MSTDAAATIRSSRERAGLTQAELARRAGVSQPVVSAYEHGRRDPSLTMLQRLVRATGFELQLALRVPADPQALPPARSEREHADRLLDVLSLADAIPHRVTRAAPTVRIVST